MAVEKAYEFEGPQGKVSLLDLFEGRRQLIVYRAFFEPGGVGLARARLPRLFLGRRSGRPPGPSERPRHHARVRLARATEGHRAFAGTNGLEDAVVHHHRRLRHRLRCGRVARTQCFIRDGDKVFRTYFINSRGDEAMGTTWSYLDITPLGRQETWEDSPKGYPPDPAVQVVELARQLRG